MEEKWPVSRRNTQCKKNFGNSAIEEGKVK